MYCPKKEGWGAGGGGQNGRVYFVRKWPMGLCGFLLLPHTRFGTWDAINQQPNSPPNYPYTASILEARQIKKKWSRSTYNRIPCLRSEWVAKSFWGTEGIHQKGSDRLIFGSLGKAAPTKGEMQKALTKIVGRDSSVGIATRYGLGGLRIESRWRQDFPHLSRPALGPTQPPIKWVQSLFPGRKAAGTWR